MARERYLLPGIGLVSAGIVLAEVSLTRVFSVTIWYHFSFVAVSIAMLGMAASAVFIHYLRQARGSAGFDALLPLFTFLSGIFFVAGLAAYLAIDYQATFMEDGSSALRLLPTLLFLPAFYMAGAVVCALFTHHADMINRLYFADLLAAGLGGAGAVGLLELFDGPTVFALAGVLMGAAGILFAMAAPSPARTAVKAVGGFLLIVLLLCGVRAGGGFNIRFTKEFDESKLEVIHEKWSALSRITVIKKRRFRTDRPYGWGLSSKYKGPPVDEMWLEQDASAGSPIIATDGDTDDLGFLDWDVTSIAYALRDFGKVAVIGLGGGRDALLALRHNARVWGIEINPDIAELITSRFADYVGNIFSGDRVKVVLADGRTFMERTEETFDLIQISLIDSWAASAAGAYILAENNLYTLEAFRAYLSRLNPDGVLTVSRWALTQTPGEVIRMVVLALEVLQEREVEDPSRHIAVIRGDLAANLLVKTTPFTDEEINRLQERCAKMAFEPLYIPGTEGGLLSVSLVVKNWAGLDEFLAALPYDFSAPTDDRPFFFLMLRPLDALLTPFTWDTGLKANFTAVKTLYGMFLALLVVVLFIVLLPALRLRKGHLMKSPPLASGSIFMLLGLAFMLVEIPLIQKLVLVLGHPIYSLSVVLSTLLVASGIGAAASRRLIVESNNPGRNLGIALLVLALFVLMVFGGLSALTGRLLQLAWGVRVVVCVAAVAVSGFLMGMPFPTAIAALQRRGDEAAIPWLWAVNGASGVLGSVVAFVLALLSGFTAALAAGVICYLVVVIIFQRTGFGAPQGESGAMHATTD